MASQDRRYSRQSRHFSSPSSSSRKDKKGNNDLPFSHAQVVYACIALGGLVILLSRPFLVLIALVLAGYGRLYHVETHERGRHSGSGSLFSREKNNRSEHTLHLGPSRDRDGGGQDVSLHDLTRSLNLPGLAGVEEKKTKRLFSH